MFKKLIYMTALSLALASSTNASAAGECIVSGCGPYNSSSIICNNISKCSNVGSLNHNKQYSFTQWNQNFETISNVMSWLSPCIDIYIITHMIVSKAINSHRDEIAKYTIQKIMSSDFVSLCTTALSICSHIKGWPGVLLSNIPTIAVGVWLLTTDILHLANLIFTKCGVKCRIKCGERWIGFGNFDDKQQLDEEIAYLSALYSKNCVINYLDSFQGVTEEYKESERKRVVENLINCGKVCELAEKFGINQIIKTVGVDFLKPKDIALLIKAKQDYEKKLIDLGVDKNKVDKAKIPNPNNNNENNDNSKNSIISGNVGNDENNFCVLNIKNQH